MVKYISKDVHGLFIQRTNLKQQMSTSTEVCVCSAETGWFHLPSEFWRDAAPLKRKACLVRLRSQKLRLLGNLEGLSSMLLSALGERRMGCWPWGELFPLLAEFLGLENTRSFRLTFWLSRKHEGWDVKGWKCLG